MATVDKGGTVTLQELDDKAIGKLIRARKKKFS